MTEWLDEPCIHFSLVGRI
jgi:hypothetical protein